MENIVNFSTKNYFETISLELRKWGGNSYARRKWMAVLYEQGKRICKCVLICWSDM
jgi:hypothetical protein